MVTSETNPSPKASQLRPNEDFWGYLFSFNECTVEIGQRPLTRRYGLVYGTPSIRATPQSREKL